MSRAQPVPQKKDEAWVEMARRQLNELCLPVQAKLTIARSKGGFIELKASPRGPGSSVTLPFRWSEKEWGKRLRQDPKSLQLLGAGPSAQGRS